MMAEPIELDIDLTQAELDSDYVPLDPDRPGLYVRKRDGVVVLIPPKGFKEPTAWALL